MRIIFAQSRHKSATAATPPLSTAARFRGVRKSALECGVSGAIEPAITSYTCKKRDAIKRQRAYHIKLNQARVYVWVVVVEEGASRNLTLNAGAGLGKDHTGRRVGTG